MITKQRRLLIICVILVVLSLSMAQPIQFRALAQSPAHAQWTFMIYMAANNNLEPDSIINMMEMASVGSSDSVNIVVQLTRPPDYSGLYGTWGGTRRFLITKSDGGVSSGDFQIALDRLATILQAREQTAGIDPAQVDQITKAPRADQEQFVLQATIPTIEPSVPLEPLQETSVQDLGSDVNSGDGATLADFGQWAVQQYPADHYALVVWDHGGGWSMIAADDTTKTSIDMPELQTALQQITTAAGVDKLDLLGFDACLMSQLPVLVTVAPYAQYLIAAEELVPGFGWDYTAPLDTIAQNPNGDVTNIGKSEIDAFNTLYSKTEPDAAHSFDLGLSDLSKVDGVVTALGAFSDAVQASGQDEIKAIATARSNAQEFAQVGEDASITDQVSSIDLIDFMRLMTQLSQDDAVKAAAQDVIDAASQVIVYHQTSSTLPRANGLSIFFPANRDIFDQADGSRFATEFGDSLPGWQSFLKTYYGTAEAVHTASEAQTPLSIAVTQVVTGANNVSSFQDTPVITYDTNGTNIVSVQGYIILQLDSTTSAILDTFPITSATTTEDGTPIVDYPDGTSTSDFYWDARINQITDGTTSLPVLMSTNIQDDQHGFIYGNFTSQSTGDTGPANLVVDLETGNVVSAWAEQPGDNASTAQITIQAGDTFEPVYFLLDDQGNSTLQPSGQTLMFGKDPLNVSFMPAPDGTYTITLVIEDATGATKVDSATVDIQNSGLDTTQRGFKDIGLGLSFLYPWDWTDVSDLVRSDGSEELSVGDISGTTAIYVDVYDVTSLDDAVTQAQDFLNQFNDVTIGEATTGTVGGQDAIVLPYQYTDDNGQEIAGAAVVVYVPDNQLSYAVTLETSSDQLDAANSIFDTLLQSLTFFAPATD
jgi:hypothetical protein